MGDREILKLLAERDENAILELQRKYGRYCHTVAFNVLGSPEDAEECVNDAFLQLWNADAPDRVTDLKRYVAAVVRNVAINRSAAGSGSQKVARRTRSRRKTTPRRSRIRTNGLP